MRLSLSHQDEIEPVPPYDFQLTVRNPAGWPTFTPHEVWDSGILWTATHLEGELTGIRLSSSGTVGRPRIHVQLFHRGEMAKDEAEGMIQDLTVALAADEDLTPFYEMAEVDPILQHAVKDHYGMHYTSPVSLFPEALLAITLQMAPMKRSGQMMDCLVSSYGERADFDGRTVRTWPTPGRLAGRTPEELKERCSLGYRAKFIVGVARRFEEGFPDARELLRMSPEEARKEILSLPGIGRYSADIIDPHGGFPIDTWSVDIFGKLFTGQEPEDGRAAIEAVREEGLRRWGGWSWMAFFYIVQDLDNLSRKLGTELRRY